MLNYSYKIDEDEEILSGKQPFDEPIVTQKDYSLEFCYKCNTDRILNNEDSYHICSECGEVGKYLTKERYIPEIWMMNKRSKCLKKV